MFNCSSNVASSNKKNIMKSTIKIDYDRNHELKPCIKIILPLDLREGEKCTEAHDIDPRDKLVADLLHTPRNIVENYLFEVNQRLLINDGTHLLTTIAAIPEENIFHRFETAIVGRIVSEDDQVECRKYSLHCDPSNIMPVPNNYVSWSKIHEFFEWLDNQPYYNDESYDKKTDGGQLTIRHVFETCLNQEERMKAFNNTPKYKLDSVVKSGYEALDIAFDWKTSPEGWDYWNKVANIQKK